MQLLLPERAAFIHRRVYLVDGDRRVHRPDVHHGGVSLAVKVRQSRQRLRAVEFEYKSIKARYS